MKGTFVNTIYDLASKDEDIIVMMGDAGTEFNKFLDNIPSQLINMGIAEQNMMGVAVGLSRKGFIPFTYAIAPHLLARPYEQIRDDICLHNANVKIISVGSGLHFSTLGPTHHGLDDFSILKVLPNMTIFSPSNPREIKEMTKYAVKTKGPVYIRIGRATDAGLEYGFKVGKAVCLKEGNDVTLFTTGAMVYDTYQAALELEKKRISARVINIHTIKPIDKNIILKAAEETKAILTVEEHLLEGGLGESIARVIMEEHDDIVKFKSIGIDDVFCSYYGTYEEVKDHYGLTQKNIIDGVKSIL
jgi:transketolase